MNLASEALPVHSNTVRECFAVFSADGSKWHSFSPRESLLHCKTESFQRTCGPFDRQDSHSQSSFFCGYLKQRAYRGGGLAHYKTWKATSYWRWSTFRREDNTQHRVQTFLAAGGDGNFQHLILSHPVQREFTYMSSYLDFISCNCYDIKDLNAQGLLCESPCNYVTFLLVLSALLDAQLTSQLRATNITTNSHTFDKLCLIVLLRKMHFCE